MDNEKLIECVKAHKCLYDVNDKNYSDSLKKEVAWKEISKQMHVREAICKKGWALLRDSYRRAMKKAKEALKEGITVKRWRYADEMSFLLPYIRPRTKLNLSSEEPIRFESSVKIECGDESNFPEEVLQSNGENSPIPESQEEILPTITTTTSLTPQRRKKRKVVGRKQKTEEPLSAALMKCTRNLANKKIDDIEQFFASIAATVQTFPLKDRAIAKRQVFEIISNMEIEVLNRLSTAD